MINQALIGYFYGCSWAAPVLAAFYALHFGAHGDACSLMLCIVFVWVSLLLPGFVRFLLVRDAD